MIFVRGLLLCCCCVVVVVVVVVCCCLIHFVSGNKLVYFRDEAFLMGCAIEGVGEHDNGMGLLTGHA
jgi:hypothetical protein